VYETSNSEGNSCSIAAESNALYIVQELTFWSFQVRKALPAGDRS